MRSELSSLWRKGIVAKRTPYAGGNWRVIFYFCFHFRGWYSPEISISSDARQLRPVLNRLCQNSSVETLWTNSFDLQSKLLLKLYVLPGASAGSCLALCVASLRLREYAAFDGDK
ncbi:hypothetical protein NEOLEDRAFT_722802 [Neolentinus lepideus HHB14362 ss-1]|uniref:Uncharacterized protein n=1 Tax=Neolentinus lepideus HHB14362 ss-1 TaxID=1314782 RepID=A0A165Q2X6_9AGAM|nr:hypothetical protein NEOLEDRAFT_722802 [Neolentinus lepideus HHB14362 ss-1]